MFLLDRKQEALATAAVNYYLFFSLLYRGNSKLYAGVALGTLLVTEGVLLLNIKIEMADDSVINTYYKSDQSFNKGVALSVVLATDFLM